MELILTFMLFLTISLILNIVLLTIIFALCVDREVHKLNK